MAVTIKDIAKKLGISYATVSRALNNHPEVSAETRKMILKTAEEMGYKPNAIARGLVMRQTTTLGLVIPDITNPFFPEVARGVEDAASEGGYNVFLCNTNWDPAKERTLIQLLEEKRVDGLLVAPVTHDLSYLKQVEERGTPVIVLGRTSETVDLNYVVIDNVKGGLLAVEHLIKQGHVNIAFVGGLETDVSNQERLEGYQLALLKKEIPVKQEYIIHDSFKQESGYESARKLLDLPNRPSAIFAANDVLALGTTRAVEEAGMKVPGDIAVVGFDDIPFASYAEVQLTSISQPKYIMGEMAAKVLIEEIKGINRGGKKHIVLQPELVVRRSSLG